MKTGRYLGPVVSSISDSMESKLPRRRLESRRVPCGGVRLMERPRRDEEDDTDDATLLSLPPLETETLFEVVDDRRRDRRVEADIRGGVDFERDDVVMVVT